MRILGVDLGSHKAGAVVLVVDKDLHAVGVEAVEEWASETSDKELDARLKSFRAWATCLVQRYELRSPDTLAVEAPHVRYASAALVLGQILGIVRTVAWWAGMELILVSAQEGKASLTGRGSAGKGEMVTAAKMQFSVDCTDHQADSLGIALGALAKMKLANLAKQ